MHYKGANLMDIKKEFLAMLDDAADSAANSLETGREDVAEYMRERALHLSTIAGEPGFGLAVSAEATSVAMFAGLSTQEASADADVLIWGMISGAIRIAALALV